MVTLLKTCLEKVMTACDKQADPGYEGKKGFLEGINCENKNIYLSQKDTLILSCESMLLENIHRPEELLCIRMF